MRKRHGQVTRIIDARGGETTFTYDAGLEIKDSGSRIRDQGFGIRDSGFGIRD
jgi:hypothetical protein